MRIKVYRLKNRISQAELARKLGVDQTAVSQWETGQTLPRTSLLPRLAEILGCKVDDLFERWEEVR